MKFFLFLFLLLCLCHLLWRLFWYVRRAKRHIEELQAAGELPLDVFGARKISSARSAARCAEMSLNGAVWNVWNLEEAALTLTGSHLLGFMRFGSGSCCFGPMRFEVDGDTLLIFDMQIALPGGKNLCQPILQTIIANSPQDLDLPHFYIRPYRTPAKGPYLSGMSFQADARLSRYDAVDSINLHTVNYTGESYLPGRAKTFFETDFAALTLLPFISERHWTVEWSHDRLVVYTLNQLVSPTELQYFAADVRELAELVALAFEAHVACLDERLQQAANRVARANR